MVQKVTNHHGEIAQANCLFRGGMNAIKHEKADSTLSTSQPVP